MSQAIGPWIAGAILLSICNLKIAAANTNRINWIIEQVSAPPLALPPESGKFQAGVAVANTADSFSTQGSAMYDASLIDFGVKFSGRFFSQLTDDGKTFKAENLDYRQNYSVHIGRSYLTRENNFGRLSAEFIQFNPLRFKLLRIGANTGILETPSVPWILRINFNVFLVMRKAGYPQGTDADPSPYRGFEDSKIFHGEAEIGQRVSLGKSDSFRLGAMLGWTYRTREIPEAGDNRNEIGVHFEHMLFSIGPWLEYGNTTSQLRLSIPWRIWLDKEVYKKQKPDGTMGTFVRYPNEMGLPDVSLAWVLCL